MVFHGIPRTSSSVHVVTRLLVRPQFLCPHLRLREIRGCSWSPTGIESAGQWSHGMRLWLFHGCYPDGQTPSLQRCSISFLVLSSWGTYIIYYNLIYIIIIYNYIYMQYMCIYIYVYACVNNWMHPKDPKVPFEWRRFGAKPWDF